MRTIGKAFTGFPGFEWDLDPGTGSRVERNLAVDPDGGFARSGSASSAAFTADSAACNPAGQEAIGYRKPTGVHR